MPQASRTPRNPDEPRRQNQKVDDAMRERIISAIFLQGHSVAEVSKNYGYHTSTIQSVIRVFEDTGRIRSKPRGGNRKRVLSDEQVEWIAQQVDNTELTIEAITALVHQHFGLSVTMSSMGRYVTKIRAGYKLELVGVSQEQSPPTVDEGHVQAINSLANTATAHIIALQTWASTVQQQYGNMSAFVFVGIFEFQASCGHRIRGTLRPSVSNRHQESVRNNIGAASSSSSSSSRNKNPILMVAVDKTMGVLIYDLSMKPTVKTVDNFLSKKLLPFLSGSDSRVIVMDTERISTMSQDTRQAIESAKHTLLVIPQGGHALNATYPVFRHVKLYVRLCDSQVDTMEALPKHIYDALDKVTQANTQEWIEEANRVLGLAAQGQPIQRQLAQEQSVQGHPIQEQAPQGQPIPAQVAVALEHDLEAIRQFLSA